MSIGDGGILRIVASFLWSDGNVAQNVFNCVVTGGTPPYDEVDITDDAEDWLDDMFANLTTVMSDEIDGNSVIVYEYDSGDADWDEVGHNTWGFDPTAASEQIPRGAAGLVRLWTTDADVQGRKFIPGLVESNLVDGLFDGGLTTALLAFALDWLTPFVGAASGATFTPGVWSVVGIVFKAAVDHYATSTIPAYQRRRKRGVGI